jgi:nucleotide-binding universal stress UspA family protein
MYQRILLAYNGFADCRSASRHAADLAKFTGAELHILGIVATITAVELAQTSGTLEVLENQRKQIRQAVDEAAQVLNGRGMKVTTAFQEGDPALKIVSYVHQIKADLCVLASADNGSLARWLQGSAGNELLKHLPCSLLIPRAG